MQAVELTFIIALCIAIIYWLDAPDSIASALYSLIVKRDVRVTLRKPFGCPTCMTFWVILVVLLCVDPSMWWMAFVWAWLSKYLSYALVVVDKMIMYIFNKIDSEL